MLKPYKWNKEDIKEFLELGFEIAGNTLVRTSLTGKINLICYIPNDKFVIALAEHDEDNGIICDSILDVKRHFNWYNYVPLNFTNEEIKRLEDYNVKLFNKSNYANHKCYLLFSKWTNGVNIKYSIITLYQYTTTHFQSFDRMCIYLDYIYMKD